jgi:alpha-glucosidase
MSAVAAEPATLLAEPHHDGSDLYVLERPEELGGEATIRLRIPRGTLVEDVALRAVLDGEPHNVAATVDRETATETWWRATFPVRNPATRYRWLLAGGDVGYAWLNGLGLAAHDVPDADDFVLTTGPAAPDWHLSSVVYEVFPDRFASSGLEVDRPAWAVRKRWDERPTGSGVRGQYDFFGGDLRGVEQRLDYLDDLGVGALYLTPIFPAGTTHRYDAHSFERVDPLLGGDDALASLIRAAHARGLRVLGDLTTNHTGVEHEWFPGERDFYFFDESLKHGYESWFGVPTLPKLNWGSPRLREAMAGVARRWLDFGLDGWRIDVANMTGRRGAEDLLPTAAATVVGAAEGKLVIAEHGHDWRGDVGPGRWHGVMNYSGFFRPVSSWLRRDDLGAELRRSFWGMPVGLPQQGGEQAVATMRAFRAGVPWEAVLHSWTLLDSHDTARFRTVAGSRQRHAVGIGLQMTTPGVPMLFAGDELGLEGESGEDSRRPMPWDRPESWDRETLETYRRLIRLRRSSEALTRGGLRYAYVDEDAIAYLREAPGERLLVVASRAAHDRIRLPLDRLGARELEPVTGGEAAVESGVALLPADGPTFDVWRLS